jgi:hypothetical protein
MNKENKEKLASNAFNKYLIKRYMNEQLGNLIRTFQSRYPEYMTVEDLGKELKINSEMINTLNIEMVNKPAELQKKQSKKHKIPPNETRCCARVWDVEKLVWILNDKKTYGNQCHNQRQDNSKYCPKHNRKLTHGDWFIEPSDVMRGHFQSYVDKHQQIAIT